MKKLIVLAAMLLVLFTLTACGSEQADTSPFTDMDTVDLNDNQITSDVFAENKLTLVNLWNLGCTACIEEMPTLDQINDDLAGQGVAVMGLYYNFGQELSDADRASIAQVLEGTDFPHLIPSDAMMKTSQLRQISVFPLTFFVDSEGNIVDTVAGSRDYEDWSSEIEKQLKKVEKNG